MKLLEADTKRLEYLLNLSYGTLYIPYSQRPYEWKKAQVLRLFNDFYSVYKNEDESANHILNFITIRSDEEENNKKYIYDGQQRTVTSLLLLTALIHELPNMGDSAKKSADALTSLYLYTSHWRDSTATELKIIFGNDKANYMLHEIIFKNKELPKDYSLSDYDKAIYENYGYIKELIHERFTTLSVEDILDFIDTILNHILVIIIETSYENIAEDMFETLNSTGLQIEDFYVLKNALIKTLDEDTVKPIWSNIEINTDRISKNKFLHAFVSTIRGKTPASDLYDKIVKEKKLGDSQIALAFLKELEKASEIFMKINNPSQRTEGTQEQNSKYLQYINNLSLLNANQYKPIIIAMGLKDFKIGDVNTILEKIISLQLRNIFIANYQANTLEQFYPTLAFKIYEGKITHTSDILKEISGQIISDSKLYEEFNNRTIETRTDESVIRFILKEIYNRQHQEIIINKNSRDVNLEHILPVKPAKDSKWLKDFPNDEERNTSTRKIGNLTVLLNRLNSSIKNNDFNVKKESYLQSKIPQNQELSKLTEWNKPNIDQRTIDLYNTFKDIWSK
ncbi:DUF262 domain-containing protein [Bacillus mycoides]|uniref:DUF262 domain-containing protein n=1 Tax=Bacillus mycoides TaxID=1405 RepID=UPI003D64E223